MGRPKGSKNKVKADAKAPTETPIADTDQRKLPLTGAQDRTEEIAEIELPTPIAETEVMHVAAQHAREQRTLDSARAALVALQEAHRKEVTEQKKRIAEHEKEVTKLSREVLDQARYERVKVRTVKDYSNGQIYRYRLDRGLKGEGELYEQTAMDPAEREKAIFEQVPSGERLTVDDDEPAPEVQA